MLTTDGHLYATGKGDFGRLGRGDTSDEIDFHELPGRVYKGLLRVKASGGTVGPVAVEGSEAWGCRVLVKPTAGTGER